MQAQRQVSVTKSLQSDVIGARLPWERKRSTHRRYSGNFTSHQSDQKQGAFVTLRQPV